VGDRADCLFKDCLVVVTGWTDAPIPWPRALPVGRMGHPSLLVKAELARAVRNESAEAARHWWGVSGGVVHRWRRALGVTRTNNAGTRRLMLAASAKGAGATRGVPQPEWRSWPVAIAVGAGLAGHPTRRGGGHGVVRG
jgi:hypothetical protein